jgi:hypothetical protein
VPEPPPHNVVLTRRASEALRMDFIGWQCRVRQLAAREQGGRPSPGMCPRVFSEGELLLADRIVTVLMEAEPAAGTEQFRYEYLKTQDPNERYERVLQILQAGYFQDPRRFSGLLTASFSKDSALAVRLLASQRCVLEFEQYTQGYRLPCEIGRLAAKHPLHRATYWHNRLFNPRASGGIEVLCLSADWAHASAFRREPRD